MTKEELKEKKPPRTKKVKEVEVKEVEIKEPKKEEPKEEKIVVQKESNTGFLIVLTLFVLVLAALCLGAFAYIYKNLQGDTRKAADLKYTDTVEANKNTNGEIFITDVSSVVDNTMPSIVAITSKTLVSSGNYGPYYRGGTAIQTGAGSGIIISQSDTEMLILTNNHVVEDAKELSVQFINEMSYDATIKGTSATKDIAVIAVKKKDVDTETLEAIKIATLGDSSKLKVGEGVIAIGNALGYGQSVTTGVVSALNREVTVDKVKNKMIQTDAPINGGNSGGALLNSKGEVVGINSVKYSTSILSTSASIEGMGFAIPISDVSDLIKDLMEGKSDTSTENIDKERGYLGITGYMIDEAMVEKYGMPSGVYVQQIHENSKVIEAGIKVGDIITKVNGKEITEFDTLTSALANKKPGDTIKLTIKYGSEKGYLEKEVVVELSKYEDVQ